MNPEYSYPNAIYLFLQHVPIDEQGKCPLPEFFWTIDPEGRSRLNEEEVEEYLGIIPGDPILDVWWREYYCPWWVYGSSLDIQKAFGFDPETDAFAKFLGLTDEVWIEPSELRFSEGGTSLNRYTSEHILTAFCTSTDDSELSPSREVQNEIKPAKVFKEDEEPVNEGPFTSATCVYCD